MSGVNGPDGTHDNHHMNGRTRAGLWLQMEWGRSSAGLSAVIPVGLAVGLSAGVAMLAGCAASTVQSAETTPGDVETIEPDGDLTLDPLEQGASQAEIERRMKESMRLYDDLFDGSDNPGSAVGRSADMSEVGDASGASEEDAETVVAPAVAVIEEAREPEPTAEERAQRLALELEAVLRESADDPYRLAIRLAGLLAGEEDAAQRLSAIIERLPEDQRAVARAVAAIVGGVGVGSDPAVLTEALLAQAESLDEAMPVRIGTLALCSRVEAFGRFTELPSSGFVAGQPMRMIVYAEVDHFDRVAIGRPVNGVGSMDRGRDAIREGWEVRLSMELQLFHEADGLLAWRRPEEVSNYRSRSRPNDFFVTNQIELPRALTVGAYRLKVVLRDLADRSVDERIIPIRVVADPALTRRDTTSFGG